MLEGARRGKADIGVFSVNRDGAATGIHHLQDPGLWENQAVRALLEDPDESERVAALVRRGWLDL
jgi:hypothetical protein